MNKTKSIFIPIFRKSRRQFLWTAILILSVSFFQYAAPANRFWGFHGHKIINKTAVFTLPESMLGFYKANIEYIELKSVNPDMRRYIDPNEAPRHYIDLEYFGEIDSIPKYWSKAVNQLGIDSLHSWGILPWHIDLVVYRLTEAFKEGDSERILRLSTDLGHYVADAHVPLHTTENYNGQLTDQHGIHGFWESRLPEIYSVDYELLTGRAKYLEDPREVIWRIIRESHLAVDSVLTIEKDLDNDFAQSKKYGFEDRGKNTVKVYSRLYSRKYHQQLDGMVERRMRSSIHVIGSLWYTCWVNAGQPNLMPQEKIAISDSITMFGKSNSNLRQHGSKLEN